jgi:hypothetical protein
LSQYKPNELEMALRIAIKAIDKLMEEKPKGGLVVNRGQDTEARMYYQEAKLCMERIQRRYGMSGAFSFGICGCCTKWDTKPHCTAHWKDFGTCKVSNKTTHRYDSCDGHSRENGGWGL